jgi:hypothetical protein
VRAVFGGEVVSVPSFVDAWVGSAAAGRVETFEEFMDGSPVGLFLSAGGEIPPGR